MNEYPSLTLTEASSSEFPLDVPQLYVSEWLAVSAILGFLTLLTVLVIFGRYDNESAIIVGPGSYLKSQYVEVYIEGAVKSPGAYQVKTGTLIKDAIALAEPSIEADIKRMREGSRVRNGQNIVVPKREMLTIYVSGAVQEECEVIVPKGTRMQDLCKYIAFTDDADISKISSKRYLKADEQVKVPVKRAKKGPRALAS